MIAGSSSVHARCARIRASRARAPPSPQNSSPIASSAHVPSARHGALLARAQYASSSALANSGHGGVSSGAGRDAGRGRRARDLVAAREHAPHRQLRVERGRSRPPTQARAARRATGGGTRGTARARRRRRRARPTRARPRRGGRGGRAAQERRRRRPRSPARGEHERQLLLAELGERGDDALDERDLLVVLAAAQPRAAGRVARAARERGRPRPAASGATRRACSAACARCRSPRRRRPRPRRRLGVRRGEERGRDRAEVGAAASAAAAVGSAASTASPAYRRRSIHAENARSVPSARQRHLGRAARRAAARAAAERAVRLLHERPQPREERRNRDREPLEHGVAVRRREARVEVRVGAVVGDRAERRERERRAAPGGGVREPREVVDEAGPLRGEVSPATPASTAASLPSSEGRARRPRSRRPSTRAAAGAAPRAARPRGAVYASLHHKRREHCAAKETRARWSAESAARGGARRRARARARAHRLSAQKASV